MVAYSVWGRAVAGSTPVIPTMTSYDKAMTKEMKELYSKYEVLLEEYRVEWEATKHKSGRRENYWQGKKDGLRTAMNLFHQLMQDHASVD